jgi:hypothetical protein
MAVFILLAGGSKKEEYYGTWVNTDYDRSTLAIRAKTIHNHDGTMIKYVSTSDTEPYETATFTIEDKWTDSEGNIWYKILYTETEQILSNFELTKISDNGTTLELVISVIDYPTEIDPNNDMYRIYYRQ